MSSAGKPDYKIRCGQCEQQIRPIWTMQAIRCPCCHNIIPITRMQPANQDNSPTGAGSLSGSAGNRQSLRFESFYNRVRVKISGAGSYCSDLSSHSRSSSKGLSGDMKMPESRLRKRAVLCGVTYRKRKYKLKGTLNDVKAMKQLLMERFGFVEESIRILTEEEKDQRRIPTKKNIQEALDWLVQDSWSGDSLVFYFSGHGLRVPENTEGDELDGFDETICPVDFTKEGMILDDEINSRIVRPLKEGVTLHAIVDSCHSGTILDLPNVYDYKLGKWSDNRPPSGATKGTMGGLAISLSACADAEIAADTSALTGKIVSGAMSGAMTYSFVDAVRKNPAGLTYGKLVRSMHEVIEEANKSNCLNSSFLSRIFHAKLLQEPVLSSSEIFDVNSKKFEL
ncbi:metacaspase-1-like isoform X1 [Punica granatum]|uniref:Metacaspase-1-like isoform X1 n=3 Tax=Punica granatum TaxID=22663 RepID=A0A6P8CLH5_PUNGR|nr:metacaspase-1-like isoform X1 [Punica granatum]